MLCSAFRATLCALLIAFVFGLATSATPAAAANVSAQDLAKVLKENPELVLDVLRQNQEQFYSVLEEAAQNKRRQDARDKMAENLKDPKTPVIEEDRILLDAPKATVTVVEYSDYQCPYCKITSTALSDAMKELGDGQIRLVFKNYPLSSHKSATLAAYFYEAVFLQSKEIAYKFHKKLFSKQEELDKLGDAGIRQMAIDLGADPDALERDLRNPIIRERLTKDAEEFRAMGYKGVPVLLMNGMEVGGGGVITKETILDAFAMVTKGPDTLEPVWTSATDDASGGLVDDEEEDCMECLEE